MTGDLPFLSIAKQERKLSLAQAGLPSITSTIARRFRVIHMLLLEIKLVYLRFLEVYQDMHG